MRLIRSSLLLAVPFTLLAFACGGKVVVDAPTGTGGAGGAGGASQSSSVVASSSSVMSSSAFVAASSSVSSSTIDGVTTTTTTGSGTMTVCDGTGDCQDGPGSCLQCALQDPCVNELDLCQSNVECMPFIDCVNNCAGQPCQQACTDKFPKGAQLYQSLIVCVICKACPTDCQQFTMGLCP